MKILGLDSLVFGVKDIAACTRCLTDYGLQPVDANSSGGRFEALDGTSIEVRAAEDPTLPQPLDTADLLRETVYGVADSATLDAIADELRRDRDIRRSDDGAVRCRDDTGFALRFQVSVRRRYSAEPELINSPGAPPHRPVNRLGADPSARLMAPRTLSHVVYFVPDFERAEGFYVRRLGFRCTDRFTGVGPFLRPAGSQDHHTLFLIQTPQRQKGIQHFTFHMGGPTELLQIGARFVHRGYQSFWGPGRHLFGSNWFWYFESPFGCHIEYDADMDVHDDSWKARTASLSADNSQLFLFQFREKWAPGGLIPEK
jgi:catechol 2,3-dioxygenase-like lactoylglutathione lyase family enzyme